MIWMEGLPPELEQRAHESIARNHAAVRATLGVPREAREKVGH